MIPKSFCFKILRDTKIVKHKLADITQEGMTKNRNNQQSSIESLTLKKRTFQNVIKELEDSDTTELVPRKNTEESK